MNLNSDYNYTGVLHFETRLGLEYLSRYNGCTVHAMLSYIAWTVLSHDFFVAAAIFIGKKPLL